MGEYIGGTRATTLKLLCDSPPTSGLPLTAGRSGLAVFAALKGDAISPGAITLDHEQNLRLLIFGGGVDGEAVCDGENSVTGMGRSGLTYTLSQDCSFSQLSVLSGVSVRTNGWRLFAHRLTLFGTAVVHADGNSGGASSGPTKGAAGTCPGISNSGLTLGAATNGGGGGQGGESGGESGEAGNAGTNLTFDNGVTLGGRGGNGGAGETAGGAGAGLGGPAGVSGTIGTSVTTARTHDLGNLTRLTFGSRAINGGSGGGGGGGGGAISTGAFDGGGGGGGGAGGGVLLLAADVILLDSWTGRISANGGAGGAGAAGAGAAGEGGGGGGGGGGFVQIAYTKLTGGAFSASNVTALGGAGGVSVGGNAGSAGNAGNVRIVDIGRPTVAVTEMTAARVYANDLSEDAGADESLSVFFVELP